MEVLKNVIWFASLIFGCEPGRSVTAWWWLGSLLVGSYETVVGIRYRDFLWISLAMGFKRWSQSELCEDLDFRLWLVETLLGIRDLASGTSWIVSFYDV